MENARPGGAKEYGLPKRMRLAKRWQFLAVTDRRKRPDLKFSSPCFLLTGRANGLDFNRLGVTVSKKTAALAVDRNRIKRIVREFFRLNTAFWPAGYDLVFIARVEAARAGRRNVWDDLGRLGQKLAGRRVAEAAAGGAAPGRTPENSAPDSRPNTAAAPRAWPVSACLALYDFVEWLFKGLALGLIYMYQRLISPLFPPSCRFRPTCSRYAVLAITQHGLWRGSYLTVRRLLKCHPFHPGGYDPVPPGKNRA